MTTDTDALASALREAVEAAKAALADYEAQTTPSTPSSGPDAATNGRDEEVRPDNGILSEPAAGSAAQQARDALLRRGHTRTDVNETRQMAVETGSTGIADARERARADYARRHPQRSAR